MTASQVFGQDLIKDKDKEAALSSVEGFDSETDIDKQLDLSKTLPIGGTSRDVGEMEEDFEFVEIPESLQLDYVPDISKFPEVLPEIIRKSDALVKKEAILVVHKGEKDFKTKSKEEELDHSEDEKEKDEMESEFLLVSSIPDKTKPQPHDDSPDDSGGPAGLSRGFRIDSTGHKESITRQFKESGESDHKPSDHKQQPQESDQDVLLSDFEYDTTTTDSINVSKKIKFFEQKIIKTEFTHDEKEDRLEKETIKDHFIKSNAEVKKNENLLELGKQTDDETKRSKIKNDELLLSPEYIAMSVDEPTDQNERLVEQKLEEIFKKVDKDDFQDAKEIEEIVTISEDPFAHKSLKQPAMAALFASQIPMTKEEFSEKYEEKLGDASVTEKIVEDSFKYIEGTSDFFKQGTIDAYSLQPTLSEQESDSVETKQMTLQDVDTSKEIGTTLKQAALAAMFVVKDSDKESEEEKEASEDSEKGSVTMKQAFMAARFITKDFDKDSVSQESDEENEEISKNDEVIISKPIRHILDDKQLIEEIPSKSFEEIDKKSVEFRKESKITELTKELYFEEKSIDDKKEPILIKKTDKIKLDYDKVESKEEIEHFTPKHETEIDKTVTDSILESSYKKESFESKTDIDKSVGMKTAIIATMFTSVKERDSESEEEKEVTVEKEIPEEMEKSISIKHAAMAAMFISRESETSASSTDEEKEIISRKKDIDSEDLKDFESMKTMKESAIAALFVSKRFSPATVCAEDEEKEVTIEKEYTEESEKITSLQPTGESFIKRKDKDPKELVEKSDFQIEKSITEEASHVTIKQAVLATVFIGKEAVSSQQFKESEISESTLVSETEEIFTKSDITSKDFGIEERIKERKEDKYVSVEELYSATKNITEELFTDVDDIKKTEDSTLLDLTDKTHTTLKQAGLAAVFISKEDDLCQESEIDSHKEIGLKTVPSAPLATIFLSDEMKTLEKEDSEDTMSEEEMVEVAGLQKEINIKPAALAALFLTSETKFSTVHSDISDMQPFTQSDDVSTVTLPDKSLLDLEHLETDIDPAMIEPFDPDLDISEKELESDEEKEIDEAFGTASINDPLIEEHQKKHIYLKQKMPIEIDKDVKFDLTEHLKELEKTVHYATSITGSLHSQQITSELSEMKLMKGEEAEKYKIKDTDEFITAAISDVSDSMKGFFKESDLESHLEEKVVEKIEKVITKIEDQSSEIKDDKKTDFKGSRELFQKQITTKELQKEEDQSPEKFVLETIESVHKIKCQEEQLIATFESGTTVSMLDTGKTRNGDKVLAKDQFIVEIKKQEERIIEIIDEKSESEIDDGTEKFEMESPEDVKPLQKHTDTFLSDDEIEDNENEICAVAAELVAKVLEKTVDQLSSEHELNSGEEKDMLYNSEIISTTLESKSIEKEFHFSETKKDSQTIFAAMTNIPNIKQDTALRTVSPTPYEIVPELSSEKSEIVLTTTDAMQLPTALVTSQPPFLLEQPLVAEHVIVPPQTKEEAVKSQPLTDSVSRVDQVLKTPIDVEERFPLPSSKETYHDIILEKHPPITKISPEEESSSSEEEISPVEEYPPTLGADMKIPVGVSPTEEEILSELPDVAQASESELLDKKIIVPNISQIKSETSTAKQDISRGYDTFMCYDNGAFVGEEQIDLEESMLERDEESDCVQQELEVTREILKRWEEEKAAKEIEPVESLYQFDYREESVLKQIKSEIFSEEMEQSIGTPSPEAKQIFKDSPEEIVAKHIRSEIFATEMEQSIDTPSPEQKEIFEEGEEETVARHIRSEIFAEEFNQSIETPSPERKEISQSLSSESLEKDETELTEMQREVVEKTVQQIIQSSAEICAEEASREMKISLTTIDKRPAEIELTEKSFNIAEEHTPEQVLWEVSVQEQLEPREETETLISTKESLSLDSQFSDKIHHVDDSKALLDHFKVATVSSDVVALAIHGEKEAMSLEKQIMHEIEKHESRKISEECSKLEEQILHESEREETRKFSSEGSEISGEDLEEKTDFHLSHEHVMSEITAQMYQHDIYKSCESSDDDLKESSDTQEDTLIEIQEKELLELDSTISKTAAISTSSFKMPKEPKIDDNSCLSGRIQFREDFDIEPFTKIATDDESLTEEYEKEVDIGVSHHKSLSEPYDSSDSYKSYGDSDKMTSDSPFYAFDTSSSHASQETAEGYMTCVTSQEGSEKTSGDASYRTPVTSQDSYKITVRSSQEDSYHTAHSSWSSSGVSDSSYDESAASSVASSYKSKYETSESETMLASDTETEERTSTPKVFEDKYLFEEEFDSLHDVEASHSKTKSNFEDALESEFHKKYFDEALEAWCDAGKTEYAMDKDEDDDHPDSPFEIIDTAEIALCDDYTEPSSLAAASLPGSVMETSQTSTTESFESLHAESEQISSMPSYSHINGPVEVDYYPHPAAEQRTLGSIEIEHTSDSHTGAVLTTIETSSVLEQSPDEPAISRTESGEYLSNELLDEYAEYSVSSESQPSSGGRLLSEGSDEMARSFEQTQLLELTTQETFSTNASAVINTYAQSNGPVEVEYTPETSPHFPIDENHVKSVKSITDSKDIQSTDVTSETVSESDAVSDQYDPACKPEALAGAVETKDDENTVYFGERYSDLEDMIDTQEELGVQESLIAEKHISYIGEDQSIFIIPDIPKQDEELSESSSSEQDIQNIQEIQELQEIQEMQEYIEIQQEQYSEVAGESDMFQYNVQRSYEEYSSTITEESEEIIEHDFEIDTTIQKELDERPISQAESIGKESEIHDSDDQKVWSELQFSDEHPDSEFKELGMHPSDIVSEKEIEDYERPATPEPSEEYEIKHYFPESEASTVAAENEEHRDSHFAVSEYVSTITEESKSRHEKIDISESESRHEKIDISESKIYTVLEKKDSSHISGEKDQISCSLEQKKLTSQSSVDIPDITITQHMSPEIDSDESLDLDIKKETADVEKISKHSDVEKVSKHSEAELVESLTDSQEMESFEIIEKIDTDSLKDISSEDNFEIVLKPKKVDEILEENIDLSQFDDGGMVKISTDKLEEEELAALKELQEQIILETSEFVTETEKESEKLTQYSFEFVTNQQFSSIEENQEQEEYERAEQEYGQFAEFDSKNTPDFDSNHKRFFSKSGENDDVSVSSLQEFEGLEMEIRRQEMLSKNNGSDTDSQNGKRFWSRSGDHDDVSMSSLQEFEKLEQELTEEEKLEADKTYILEYKAVQSIKDHTTLETEKLEKSSQDSDINEYEKRMSEIDEIIRQAESNLESFEAELQQREHQQLCELKSTDTCSSQGTESSIVERSNIIDDSDGDGKTTLTMDTTEGEHIAVTRTVSGHSSASQISRESHGQSPTSLTPQCDSDSLKDRELDFEEQEFDSHFSREHDFDTDSLQEKMMTDEDKDREFDRDSLQAPEEIDQEFDDSLQEKKVDGHDYDRDSLMGSSATSAQLFEDDNTLEPSSSSATHATYQDNDSLQASVTSSLPLSSDDNAAMISSVDSLNAEQTITSITTDISSSTIIPNQGFDPEIYNVLVEHDPSNQFIDREGNIHSETWYETVTQSYIDPEGNIRTITTYTEKDGTSEMAYHETTSDIAEELISSHEPIKHATETDTDPQMGKVVGYDISSCPAEIGDYISEKRPSEEIVTITRKIHHIVDPGSMSKEQLSKVLQQSEPQITKEEITDQMGNITRTVVCKTTKVSEPMSHTFTGPDADQQMAEFLRKSKKMEWEDEDSGLDKCAQIVMKKQVEFLAESPEKELTERTHEVVETSETTDEKGNIVRVVTRKVTHFSEPQIHKYSYSTEQETPSSCVSLEDKFGAVSHESKIIKTAHLSESIPPTDDHTAPFKSKSFAPREGGLPLDSTPSPSSETLSHSEECYYSGLEAVSTILSTQPSLDWSEPSHHASGQEYKVDASRPSIDEEGEVEVDITEHDDLRGVTEPTDFMEPYERQVQIVKDEISGAPHMTSGASGVVTRTVTSTIRDGDQVTTTVTETTEGGEHDQQLQQSMREIIDQFMADPQTQQYYQQYTYEDQDEE